MTDTDLDIGTCVIVRDWDDMVHEFGLDEGDYIRTPVAFVSMMRQWCNSVLYVIKSYEDCARLSLYPEGRDIGWNFPLESLMLYEENAEEISLDDLMRCLNGN